MEWGEINLNVGPLDGDATTLNEARLWVLRHMMEGVDCPTCSQLVKVYKRKMTAVAAAVPVRMWALRGQDWIHIPTVIAPLFSTKATQGGYLTLSSYWGIIEPKKEKRDDGVKSGSWRLTNKGKLFVTQGLKVPQYVYTFDSTVLEFYGDRVSVDTCLATKFNLTDLMEGK